MCFIPGTNGLLQDAKTFLSPLFWSTRWNESSLGFPLQVEFISSKIKNTFFNAFTKYLLYLSSSVSIVEFTLGVISKSADLGIPGTCAECRATGFCPVLLSHYVRFFSDPISIVYMYVWNEDIQFPCVQHGQLLCNCKCLFANKLTLQQ